MQIGVWTVSRLMRSTNFIADSNAEAVIHRQRCQICNSPNSAEATVCAKCGVAFGKGSEIAARPGSKKIFKDPLAPRTQNMIYYPPFRPFGRGAVVAQLTVNQLVAGSNPAARANTRDCAEDFPPGWHSGDCASFVMRNYQGFESLTRLHRFLRKKSEFTPLRRRRQI